MNSTLHALTSALNTHFDEHPLPAPTMVSSDLLTLAIDVQVDIGPTVTRLAELLAWGESLARVGVRAWHTLDGNLHVTVTGHTSSDVRVKAYGGVPYDDTVDAIDLVSGESTSMSLEDLAALIGLVGETRAGAA